ncbi:MAG: PAS domain-containing sensor histidine kinase [Alphaproteobacteria bacterium]|nr:PAS domain-containing sensor histidine kinase [Alphaproteobacteria bacterium]
MGEQAHLKIGLGSRLFLAALVLLLPLVVFLLILVEERNRQIRIAETEIAGIRYLVELRELLELVPAHAALHQHADHLRRAGNATGEHTAAMPDGHRAAVGAELTETVSRIGHSLEQLIARAESDGDPFQVLGDLKAIRSVWQGVDHDLHHDFSQGTEAANDEIQDALVTLFRHIGNTANLELDNSLETTHLTRLIIHELPRMVAQLNSVRSLAYGIVSRGDAPSLQEHKQLSVDDWALTLAHDNLFYGYNTAVNEDPEIARNLAAMFEVFERDTNAFHAMIASGELSGSPEEIFRLGSSSIDATLALFDEIVPEVFRILDQRLSDLRRTKWFAIASVIAASLVAAVAGWFLQRAITSPLQAEIAERRHAEARLGELADIVEQSADSILTLSGNGIVTSWNRGAERLYGYSTDEIVGRSISLVAPDGYENETESLLRRSLAGEHLPPHETVRRRKDGGLIDVSLRFSILRETDGTPRGVAVIARDISERKRAEAELVDKERQLESRVEQLRRTQAELREHRDQLEDAVRARTAEVREQASQLEAALRNEKEFNALQRKFVSMASHEFRTPLAIIDGAAQRIERRQGKIAPDELGKRVSRIRGAVARMLCLIESTLSASRLDEGRIRMKSEPVDLAALVTSVCERQGELAETLDLRVDLEDLPGSVEGDPALLDQVFTNLLSNAAKYSPRNPRIEVTGQSLAPELIRISVADNGVGIPAEDLDRLFDRFFRASTSEGIPGTGIGLNLAHDLVVLHGGTIDVESQVGAGTVFHVTLPTRQPTVPRADLPHEPETAAA